MAHFLRAVPGINSKEKEAYFKEELRAFRKAVSIPLILVGGIRSFGVAERLVDDGTADYISMCRPFIREPDLINRWKARRWTRKLLLGYHLPGREASLPIVIPNLRVKPALQP